MKLIIALFALLLILALGITFFQKGGGFSFPFGKMPTATIGITAFKLLVAKTPKETETGLSGRNSLPKDQGMIFIFKTAEYYSFWMKDMKFPLDLIYINDNKIVTIRDNVPNPKTPDESLPIYKPDAPANMVLEINAGLSKEKNIKVGDTVTFKDLDTTIK